MLCAVLLILTLAVLLLGGCSSDEASSAATPDESAPASAPAAQDPTIDDKMLHGETADAGLFIGSWVSYPKGNKVTYTFDDDGCAIFLNAEGNGSEYHYEVEGDRIIMTSGEKRRIYIWSERALTFLADNQYGEISHLTALIREKIEDFSGYMYVKDDYLYLGMLCMCRTEQMSGFDDDSLVGNWTGADGDRVTFTADGAYSYIEYGIEYNGTYSIDEENDRLILSLPGTDDSVLTGVQWGVGGRVLHLGKHYYYRDTDE